MNPNREEFVNEKSCGPTASEINGTSWNCSNGFAKGLGSKLIRAKEKSPKDKVNFKNTSAAKR
jgi:hypothetical protein